MSQKKFNLKILDLIRVYEKKFTWGRLLDSETKKVICWTLELPWRENKRNISCIPEGHYLAQTYESLKFGITFLIDNISDRDNIIFHPGNTLKDTRGCILPGDLLNASSGYLMKSRCALDKLLNWADGKDFIVKVGSQMCSNPSQAGPDSNRLNDLLAMQS